MTDGSSVYKIDGADTDFPAGYYKLVAEPGTSDEGSRIGVPHDGPNQGTTERDIWLKRHIAE